MANGAANGANGPGPTAATNEGNQSPGPCGPNLHQPVGIVVGPGQEQPCGQLAYRDFNGWVAEAPDGKLRPYGDRQGGGHPARTMAVARRWRTCCGANALDALAINREGEVCGLVQLALSPETLMCV